MAGEMAEEARKIFSDAAVYLPPSHVIHDLSSSGVCVRCIFRLFGIHGDIYSSPLLTTLMLDYFLKEKNGLQGAATENELCFIQLGESLGKDHTYCTICLGILQFANDLYLNARVSIERSSIDVFVETITESIKEENHQIDGFFLEVSIPAVIVANERAIWLYIKKKYEREAWFNDEILYKQIPLKESLRLSITNSLEKLLGFKSGSNSFRVRLTYSHFEASASVQNALDKAHISKKIKTDSIIQPCGNGQVAFNEQLCSKSDAAMLKALSSLHDNSFCELFKLPPDKVCKACQLTITCYRMPIYIGGRYLKLSRKVSQTRWIIDDERMGEASVEELVGMPALEFCRGDSYKFHAAGREDIDVRMLGSGRPFLVEVSNARCLPSMLDVLQIAQIINSSEKNYVFVKNLNVVGGEVWSLMREGEAEKQKQYAALVWISRPLVDEDLQKMSSTVNMEITQRTPVRVLHRRSPLERLRIIHWMKIERIVGSDHFFLLHLCTQAGTYIKEFVHGDLGRTSPSIGSILNCRAEILQLDVTDVKMDIFI